MITFLPTTDFEECARCLDDKRLGAQRYESYSILKWLKEPDKVKLQKAGYCAMWKGYEPILVRYCNAMLNEWAARGKNNILLQPYDTEKGLQELPTTKPLDLPPWMGNELLHSYHRHALINKFPEHYKQFGWKEDGSEYNGSYMWPVRTEDGSWILRWPKQLKIESIPLSSPGRNAAIVTPPKAVPKKKSLGTGRTPKAKRTQRTTTKRKTPVRTTTSQTSKSTKRMRLRSDRSL